MNMFGLLLSACYI